MKQYTLKELVTNTTVQFVYYRMGFMYYTVVGYEDFIFPVSIEDIGDATFSASDKGLLFMRYIRKWLEVLAEMPN